MPLLKILTAPHPILSTVARPVEEHEFGPELEAHMHRMLDAMYAADGVGLAGPQVGDSRRILVAEPRQGDDDDAPLFMMINPEITLRSDDMIGCEEGCLSVPGFDFKVPRSARINVKWRLPNGETMSSTISDFASIVIQHEIDHLDGVTLLDRASRPHRRKWLQTAKKRRRGR
tara:strand:+ start:374 stop:892 length:519 start_codon:yes stop_codon:yes gene_type:complete